MRSSLASLSSSQLTARLTEVLASERRCLLDTLYVFIELERRQLHNELSHHTSLFSYCVHELHLSEGYTFRRTTAARLLSRFPAIEPFLRDGLVSLSNLVELRDVLTPENYVDVLRRATHCTKAQILELVAELKPRPDVADSVRKLPERSATAAPTSPSLPSAPSLSSTPSTPLLASTPAPAPLTVSAPPPPLPAHSDVAPLSPGRYLLKATISADVRAKLEKVQSALSHAIPDGNLEEVLDEALTLALQMLAKQHRVAPQTTEDVKGSTFAAKVAAPEVSEGKNSRYVPAEVKRGARIEADDRCAYVGPNGVRCNSTHQLQFNHKRAFALGGRSTRENINLYCKAHNLLQAELDYGAEHMARFVRRSRSSVGPPSRTDEAQRSPSPPIQPLQPARAASERRPKRSSRHRFVSSGGVDRGSGTGAAGADALACGSSSAPSVKQVIDKER